MDAVIPQDVLDHLRELAQRENTLEGKFTTGHMAEGLGCGHEKARSILRGLMQKGRVRCCRVNVTDEEAWELGYLAGTSIVCYEWVDKDLAA